MSIEQSLPLVALARLKRRLDEPLRIDDLACLRRAV